MASSGSTDAPATTAGRWPRGLLGVGLAFALSGCNGIQWMFTANSPEASEVVGIWWLLFWSTTGIFILVTAIVVCVLLVPRRRRFNGQIMIIAGGLGLSAIFLPIYAVSSYGIGVTHINLGNLTGWIAAAQELKPGNRMPSFNHFDGETLRAIGAYLDGRE